MLPQEIIRKKRDGLKLSTGEIDEFVKGIDDWSIADGQIAAMTMALLINGMDSDEITAFVNAIVDTGMVLDWSAADLNGPIGCVCHAGCGGQAGNHCGSSLGRVRRLCPDDL